MGRRAKRCTLHPTRPLRMGAQSKACTLHPTRPLRMGAQSKACTTPPRAAASLRDTSAHHSASIAAPSSALAPAGRRHPFRAHRADATGPQRRQQRTQRFGVGPPRPAPTGPTRAPGEHDGRLGPPACASRGNPAGGAQPNQRTSRPSARCSSTPPGHVGRCPVSVHEHQPPSPAPGRAAQFHQQDAQCLTPDRYRAGERLVLAGRPEPHWRRHQHIRAEPAAAPAHRRGDPVSVVQRQVRAVLFGRADRTSSVARFAAGPSRSGQVRAPSSLTAPPPPTRRSDELDPGQRLRRRHGRAARRESA